MESTPNKQKNFRTFITPLDLYGESFECGVTLLVDPCKPPYTSSELEGHVRRIYGTQIQWYMESAGQQQLPIGVLHVGGPHAPLQVELEAGALKSYLEPVKHTCEADKPIGTRDVDRFLKEQQDKLWKDD